MTNDRLRLPRKYFKEDEIFTEDTKPAFLSSQNRKKSAKKRTNVLEKSFKNKRLDSFKDDSYSSFNTLCSGEDMKEATNALVDKSTDEEPLEESYKEQSHFLDKEDIEDIFRGCGGGRAARYRSTGLPSFFDGSNNPMEQILSETEEEFRLGGEVDRSGLGGVGGEKGGCAGSGDPENLCFLDFIQNEEERAKIQKLSFEEEPEETDPKMDIIDISQPHGAAYDHSILERVLRDENREIAKKAKLHIMGCQVKRIGKTRKKHKKGSRHRARGFRKQKFKEISRLKKSLRKKIEILKVQRVKSRPAEGELPATHHKKYLKHILHLFKQKSNLKKSKKEENSNKTKNGKIGQNWDFAWVNFNDYVRTEDSVSYFHQRILNLPKSYVDKEIFNKMKNLDIEHNQVVKRGGKDAEQLHAMFFKEKERYLTYLMIYHFDDKNRVLKERQGDGGGRDVRIDEIEVIGGGSGLGGARKVSETGFPEFEEFVPKTIISGVDGGGLPPGGSPRGKNSGSMIDNAESECPTPNISDANLFNFTLFRDKGDHSQSPSKAQCTHRMSPLCDTGPGTLTSVSPGKPPGEAFSSIFELSGTPTEHLMQEELPELPENSTTDENTAKISPLSLNHFESKFSDEGPLPSSTTFHAKYTELRHAPQPDLPSSACSETPPNPFKNFITRTEKTTKRDPLEGLEALMEPRLSARARGGQKGRLRHFRDDFMGLEFDDFT